MAIMEYPDFIIETKRPYPDEEYLTVKSEDFVRACNWLHKNLSSPMFMFFADDTRSENGNFALYSVFLNAQKHSWVVLRQFVSGGKPEFSSVSKDIYSAHLFEREIREMFGIEAQGSPDMRRLKLHDEVWPEGFYPMRKDFKQPQKNDATNLYYNFKRVEGEGIFEVPVGPVHAGVIGPGHFRFSVAGEPIINLEIRLGWTHRGLEKLLEGKSFTEAIKIFECISGDTAFGYSLAFCQSVEKILSVNVPLRAQFLRAIFLELERIYNHANDMGGIALDVGFSFPAQFASIIKEKILQLNEKLCGSRYLKGINTVGGVCVDINKDKQDFISDSLSKIQKDFSALEEMLLSSTSFMDRVDTTGILHYKTARDLGITGVAGRASGIALDMRKIFPNAYGNISFKTAKGQLGDALTRLKVRCDEARESMSIIKQCLEKINSCQPQIREEVREKEGYAIGCVEAWRGPVRVWTRLNAKGEIERCKIVDPSFQNWEGLSYAVLDNIIPDFPLCNKSFDLSYSGNDL